MPDWLSPTMIVGLIAFVVGFVIVWLIGKTRSGNDMFPPQSGTSAFGDSVPMGQTTLSDSYMPSEDYSPRSLPDSVGFFSMPIEDVFAITGRGTVVTGRVERGLVRVGDDVEIVGPNKTTRSTVTGIEKFRKTVDEAAAGEVCGIFLRGVARDEVGRGHVLVSAGTAASPASYVAPANLASPAHFSSGDYTVILEAVGDKPVTVIKQIRVVTNLGLVEAKKLADSAPCIVAQSVSREDAERIRTQLESAGARVAIR